MTVFGFHKTYLHSLSSLSLISAVKIPLCCVSYTAMAKKPVSVQVPRWKKQPTKHINKRRELKSLLKTIINYLKSDSYMFAPLIHPQSLLSSPPVSSGEEVSFKPMKKKEKKLVEDVEEYLKCDTYMYVPLVMDSAYDGTTSPSLVERCRGNAETVSVCDQMETRMEETAGGDEHRLNSSRENERVNNGFNSVRRIVVEHSLLQSESVKHIAHQNCVSSSATGEVLSQNKLPPRKVAERAHTKLT